MISCCRDEQALSVLITRAARRQLPSRWTDLLQPDFQVFWVEIHSSHLKYSAVCTTGPEQNRAEQSRTAQSRAEQSLVFPGFLCCLLLLPVQPQHCEMFADFMAIQLTLRLVSSGFYIHPGPPPPFKLIFPPQLCSFTSNSPLSSFSSSAHSFCPFFCSPKLRLFNCPSFQVPESPRQQTVFKEVS